MTKQNKPAPLLSDGYQNLQGDAHGRLKVVLANDDGSKATPDTVKAIVKELEAEGISISYESAPLVDGELPNLLDEDGSPLQGNEPKNQGQNDLTTAILRIIDKADEVSRSTTGLADEKYIAHREELIRGFTEFHNNHLQAAVRETEERIRKEYEDR